MDTFVTVLTVQYPQQLWIIKGRLESEGIQCFVKDELTVQSYNLYSNALGGVKLQVLQEDVEKAREILTELGYIKEELVKIDLLTKTDKKTGVIPVLGKLSIGYRIIIVLLLFVSLLTTLLYFIFKPSLSNLLTQNTWCVDRIDYQNKAIGPKTTGNYFTITDRNGRADCSEKIILGKDNQITLPGINCSTVYGDWEQGDDDKIIIRTDSLKGIFSGAYTINLSNEALTLTSSTTTIYAHRDTYALPLPF